MKTVHATALKIIVVYVVLEVVRLTFFEFFPDILSADADWMRETEKWADTASVVATAVILFAVIIKSISAHDVAALTSQLDHQHQLEAKLSIVSERLSEQERQILIAAKEAAEAASRARSTFLAHMSHELRTPLNGILGYSEALISGIFGPMSARHRVCVEHIQTAGQHLQALIGDLLDLARIDAGKMELNEQWAPLSPLLRAVVADVAPLADKKGLRLEAQVGDHLPEVLIDGVRFRQILSNLLSNAVKFTPDGGRIVLDCAGAADGGIAISIADTGIGMKPGEVGRLLKPFERAADLAHTEGTGLGLPLVAELVKLHHGNFTIDTAPLRGTTATVRLPAGRVHWDSANVA